MKNKMCIFNLVAAVITATGAGCASERQEQAKLQAQAKISEEQAAQTALVNTPGGTIKDGELENENGLLIWSFDIATPDSKSTTEVNVDAITGGIFSVVTETPDQAPKQKD